ncbi:carbohydrate ABC transporter permease [Vampirovibrio sp.]|uniref:carbohydrate ABC transporter permease n=1 Tax=Vampirovibrio sp. TaxID=2717857 RepID=UPI0035934A48
MMGASKLKTALIWLAMLVGALLMILPFWVMVVTSLVGPDEVFQMPPRLWPRLFHWENYQRLFQQAPLAVYLFNSVLVAVVTTVGHVLFSAMAGYAFSRLHFPHKNKLFFVFLMTMMVPPQVNIVPLFFLMKSFHWLDSYAALIVPGLFGAFGVFMLRQWFNGLPTELEEAARIDGCNPWQIFWKIALPLATPAMAALAIFVFINTWNSFMWPLIVTHSEGMRTLPVGIATLKGSFRDTTDWTVLMAAATLSILPVVIVFLIGQKQFMKGIMAGGVKE